MQFIQKMILVYLKFPIQNMGKFLAECDTFVFKEKSMSYTKTLHLFKALLICR